MADATKDSEFLDRIVIRPLKPSDQAEAKRVILEGLGEHFGFIDEKANPDLKDIASYYDGAVFVVAAMNEKVIGTGALVQEVNGIGRIVRMSVGRDQRRRGVGKKIFAHLLDQARSFGYQSVVLETNDDWNDAITFYKSCGFKEVGRRTGEIDFILDL